MNVPGYSQLSKEEKELLHAFLAREGIQASGATIKDAPATDALGINWCKLLCAIKAAAAVVACAGNPVCIAGAVAAGIACANGCK